MMHRIRAALVDVAVVADTVGEVLVHHFVVADVAVLVLVVHARSPAGSAIVVSSAIAIAGPPTSSSMPESTA